jgi:hypothetical protein
VVGIVREPLVRYGARRDKCLSFSTDRGFTEKPNPFGQINVVGTNGVFFIAVKAKGLTDYLWLPITEFNLAYWRGDRATATYDLQTIIPGVKALPAVADFHQTTLDGGAVELSWRPRNTGETYTIFKRENAPPRWEVVNGAENLKTSVFPVPQTGRYAVVANDNGKPGAFSAEQRVVILGNPIGITLDPEGRRIVRDERHNLPIMYNRNGETIGLFGTFHSNISGGTDIARMPDGRLLVTIANKDRQPLFMLDKDGHFLPDHATAGSWGSGPLQFNNPTGVTVDSQGRVWIADTGNVRVQVLDPSLETMIAEAGADCGLKSPAKVAEVSTDLFAVADPEAGRVVLLRIEGANCKVVSSVDVARPVYVAASPTRVFVSDEGKDGKGPGQVIEYSITGGQFQQTAVYGPEVKLGTPSGIAYDTKAQSLTIVDRANRRLLTFPMK